MMEGMAPVEVIGNGKGHSGGRGEKDNISIRGRIRMRRMGKRSQWHWYAQCPLKVLSLFVSPTDNILTLAAFHLMQNVEFGRSQH